MFGSARTRRLAGGRRRLRLEGQLALVASILPLALCRCQGTPSLGLATSGPRSLPAGSAEATSATSGREAHARRSKAKSWGTRWCFGAGAPIATGPALGPAGEVYVGTNEGYVHALDSSGSFLWSYTVKGAVSGGPVVLPNGHVVVGTTLGLLYALRPNGTRLWVFRTPEPMGTDLAVSARGTLVFGAAERFVYAVSQHGGMLWRVGLSAPFTTAPWVHENGTVFIGTREGLATWQQPLKRSVWPSPPVTGRAVGDVGEPSHQLWLASGRVFSSNGPVDMDGDIEFLRLLSSGEHLAVTSSTLRWVGPEGKTRREVALESEPSAPPVTDGSQAFVPMANGTLLAVAPGGSAGLHARLGFSPLSAPLLDPERRQLIAAAGEGQVCAVSLGTGSAPAPSSAPER